MAIKHDLRYGGTLAGKEEIKAITRSVIKSVKTGNWQTGREAQLMEQEAAKFLGVKYGVLTTSGSSAGLLALSALEFKPKSEVIISAVTFPTIFNIIIQCGLTPVVVDAKIGTYNFDIDEVERAITPKTKAIIAVHAVGNPCDMPKLMAMVKKYERKGQKIWVIEDNCDGWGSTIGGKKVGSFGDISITSFHAAHIVSMGVGGGCFTNNKELEEKIRIYRDWGRQSNTTTPNRYKTLPKDYNPRFIYEKIGYNFQILELQAAMGRVQLRKSNLVKKLRQKNAEYLMKGLKGIPLILPKTVEGADVCWFSLPLSVEPGLERGALVAYLEKHGIETRSMFSGDITKHPAYKDTKYKVPFPLVGASQILKRGFWITVHPRLTKSDLDYIIKTFKDYYASLA